MVGNGRTTASCPKCLSTAECVYVPTGPKKAILCGASRARQADIISRNRRAMVVSDNGPSLRSITLRNTCASRSRSEEHTSELQSRENLVCRLLLEKKKKKH